MNYKTALAAIILAVAIYGCTKKFENHDATTDSNLTLNLYQAISATSGLAKFASYIQKTGYDKVLASSKTYTVWVPTDAALATLDAATIADSAKLSQFVGNHISNQSYTVGLIAGDQRIQMLNGKYITMNGTKFDSANITTFNQYTKNGLFHIIDKFIPRTNSIWEFVNASTATPLMKTFLLSLNYQFFDSTKGVQIGVNPVTGLPTYQPGTGIVPKNVFLNGKAATATSLAVPAVMDVSNESGQYTFFMMADASYTTEFNKLTPYFKTSTADSTNNLAGLYLVKDLAFQGAYPPGTLPDTLVSQYGVKVPVPKGNIISATKTSNGWVYIMSQVSFNLNYKFPSIFIQGENPTAFQSNTSDFILKTFYRIRQNPLTGATFRDILIINAGIAAFWVKYSVPNVPSMKYNAYWVAVNDWQATTWSQRLAVDSITSTTFPYVVIDSSIRAKYTETKLGQFNHPTYSTQNLYMIGPATSSTTSGAQLSLDYIRLEPAF